MTSKAVIAIVDDDQLARTGTGELMRSLGYEIHTFPSAEEFLHSDTRIYDCLISDIQMPGMSGLELQNILKVKAPRLPVIFLTAFPNDSRKGVSMSQGACYYLEKPCPADELCACVAEVIGRSGSAS